jgi:hypothetical protein
MEMGLNSIQQICLNIFKCEKSLSELLNDGGRNCLMGPGELLVWKLERKATI